MDYVELAKKEFRGPLRNVKIQIVEQSIPAMLVCGANNEFVCNEKAFCDKVVEDTNYEVRTILPGFILQAIIIAVVQWLIKKFLDRHF